MGRKNWLLIVLLLSLMVGTASATTLTLNASHSGSAQEHTNATFSVLRNDTGDSSTDGSGVLYVATNATSTIYDYIRRGLVTFPSYDVPDDATINSVTLTIYSSGGNSSNWAVSPNLSVVDFYPANVSDYENGDYDATTFTRQNSADIPYASIALVNLTNNFTISNTTFVNKTGNTSYMVITNWETDNAPTTWAGNKMFYFAFQSYASDYPPKLTINYTEAATAPVASFTTNVTTGLAPFSVLFTDTSTNTPTGWNWSLRNIFGNNTEIWFSNVSPASISLPGGRYYIRLNASNAIGYNITPSDYIINSTVTCRNI